MNPISQKAARQLFGSLKRGLRNVRKTEVVVCPPFVYLPLLMGAFSSARRRASFGGLAFGSQDCFWQDKGAFTGEISPQMLKDLGVRYVILGHSERRQVLRETDEMVNKKIKEVLKLELWPIVCVGESARERKKGETFQVLKREIKEGFKNVPKSQMLKVVIAYEPIWAISQGKVGTGNPCSADDALTAILFIRKVISQIFGMALAKKIRILYGGSANSQNAEDYLGQEGINGLLVGGASLKPKEFLKIARG